MSDENKGSGNQAPQRFAAFESTRWPGLIWAVPVAAIGILVWLGFMALTHKGPTIHVTFPVVGGLHGGRTKVKYKGDTVGRVTTVKLARALNHLTLAIRFDPEMAGHLGHGTRFWIAGRHLSATRLSHIKTLISGPYIAIRPKPGPTLRRFQGRLEPPLRPMHFAGRTVTLVASHFPHITRGAPVYYHHFRVGEIRGDRMMPGGRSFRIYAFVRKAYEHLITPSTRFWKAGALRLKATAHGVALRMESLSALMTGAVAFGSSGRATPVSQAHHRVFRLYASRSAALERPPPNAVPYRIVFPGGPRALRVGAPVTLESRRVGQVTAVRTLYDPPRQALRTHVRIVIDPATIPLARGYRWHKATLTEQMNGVLAHLVAHGLRARIARSVPFVGAAAIDLGESHRSHPAVLGRGHPPRIPSQSKSGLRAIETRANAILSHIQAIPLAAIGRNIHATTRRLPGLVTQVRESARKTRAALDAARRVLSPRARANSPPGSGNLPRTLHALSASARSVRTLARLLSRKPNALLFGKGR